MSFAELLVQKVESLRLGVVALVHEVGLVGLEGREHRYAKIRISSSDLGKRAGQADDNLSRQTRNLYRNYSNKKSLQNRAKSITTTFARKYAIFRGFYVFR